MLLADVIGQAPVKQQLLQSVQHHRLSHALLFLDPEGAGGLPLALAFAQYVVCENKQEQDACGSCPACVKADQLIHPDIHFSYPVIPRKPGDKPLSMDYLREWRAFVKEYPYGNGYDWLQFIGAENKQGNITAHECQDLNRQLNLKSFESEYKILVMWLPEYLGNEGNRLLKLIEEPPAKTLFILVAENQEQILSTLLSRTQLVKINALPTTVIRNALQQRAEVNEQLASQIAHLAEGNYREALRLLQHTEADWLETLRHWLNCIIAGKSKELHGWIEQMASIKTGRENQKQFLRYFINLLEYAMRLQYLDAQHLPLPPSEMDVARRLQKIADFYQLEQMIRHLDAACYHIERNANAKILFHALSIQLQYIFKRKPLPL